jgi:hypothetical protein
MPQYYCFQIWLEGSDMPLQELTDADIAKARKLWAEYQREHDVSGLIGQAAGIDPKSGRIWFGQSAKDIWNQMDTQGVQAMVFIERVGSPTYLRKGGQR